jgi:hypothetical protein
MSMSKKFEEARENSIKKYGAADIEEMSVLKRLSKECYQDLDEATTQEIRSSLLKPEKDFIFEDLNEFQYPILPPMRTTALLAKRTPPPMSHDSPQKLPSQPLQPHSTKISLPWDSFDCPIMEYY